jgi:hydroxymethylpyrimidine/phosphomethylpyrimidine kinase
MFSFLPKLALWFSQRRFMAGIPKKVLTIAGSDSGGGAGIQADLKTISALGCYGTTAITALTAQNTQGVTAIHAAPPEFLADQIHAVLTDIGADAVKIGMLHSPDIVRVVAQALRQFKPAFVVLDPVMVATSGDALITPQTKEAIVAELFPLATLVTPNLDELSLLVGHAVTRPDQFADAAQALMNMGANAVLVKGGHLDQPNLVDILFEVDRHQQEPRQSIKTEIVRPRINTRNLHGTGCTLSSAIACFLAQGYPLKNAVKGAQDYVYQAITHGAEMHISFTPERGHGPVNHFFSPIALKLYSNQEPDHVR